ncbi:MAG TPA: DUF1801 domain-containing protein [Steroidobacteraceae bacterium]|nr:DUF1801 domain-containing protein [Steroidobacteraceae bacterium]
MRPSAATAEIFASWPPPLRKRLLVLRTLILETAAATPGVGKLEETLKWNEPAYLTSESKSGSTIRINRLKDSESRYAMYFNCNTHLVDSFRTLFPDSFHFRGDRAIEFDIGDPVPMAELKACIAMALTHHLSKTHKKKHK